MENQEKELTISNQFITKEALLKHWQGHRSLTRRVIEVFPDDAFYTFSLGGMRPFAELVWEMLYIEGPGIKGIASGEWKGFKNLTLPKTKKEVLQLWDEGTDQINQLWDGIPLSRFQEEEKAFDMYEGMIIDHLLYFIDNEIHHRGQAYVYLRSLGVEPPPFWQRKF